MKQYQNFSPLSDAGMMLITGGYVKPGDTQCADLGDSCSYYEAGTGLVKGSCQTNSNASCVCKAGHSSISSRECGDPNGS